MRADELHGERQAERAFAIGDGHAGNAEQRPGAVEHRVTGARERRRRLARRARRDEEIDLAQALGELATQPPRMFAHRVVLGARHAPSLVEPRTQGGAQLAAVVLVLPTERARRLVAHDHLVPVEELGAACGQVEVAHYRTCSFQCSGRLLDVRLHCGVRQRPARRAAQPNARCARRRTSAGAAGQNLHG